MRIVDSRETTTPLKSVFLPFGGFTDDTLLTSDHARPPDMPGVGYETKSDLYRLLAALAE